MKHSIATTLAACACTVALGAALVGCAPPASTAATEAQQANRAYMSQVNETMVELDDNLGQFVDAVSRGDVVNMRTQADNAYKSLDKLSGIEAPEDLKDVRESYVSGTGKLREALDAYIALYAQSAQSSTTAADFNARIAEIQALYDEGVALLQKGDDAIAAVQADSASASVSATASASSSGSSADSSGSQSSASSASA